MADLSLAPKGAKAIEYDVRLTLSQMNAIASVIGFILNPDEGANPIRREALQGAMTRLVFSKRAT